MKRWIMPIVLLAAAASFIGVAQACPMCKDSIAHSDAEAAGSLPGGFNTSVYYMLGGFFVTLGLVSTTIIRGIRNTPVKLPPEAGRGFDVKK